MRKLAPSLYRRTAERKGVSSNGASVADSVIGAIRDIVPVFAHKQSVFLLIADESDCPSLACRSG